jgi:ubiquitin carboxyl-terminal hydrolase 14
VYHSSTPTARDQETNASSFSLGNTCYMNSTIQCLRTIPELQTALQAYSPGDQSDTNRQLTAEMRRLYQSMGQTTERMIPALFLQRLRVVAPQFAEQRPGQGYAQQGRRHPTPYPIQPTHLPTDAEECLGSILNSLRQSSLNVPAELDSTPGGLVEKYLMGEMTTEFVHSFSRIPTLTD